MIAKRKYSPLYIVFEWFVTLRNAAFIALYLFVLNQSDGWIMTSIRWIFIIYIPVMLVWAIVNWFVQKYEMNEKAFVLYRGVWNRTEQTIPLHKIQNIHSKRNVFHRICRVSVLTLETAVSGENDTIRFPIIAEKEAKQIEQYIKDYKENRHAEKAAEQTGSAEESIREMSVEHNRTIHYVPTKKDLIYASFTSFNFLIIIPILFVIYRFASEFLDVDEYIEKGFGSLATSWILLTSIIVLLVIISIGIGMVRTYLTYGNYELSADEETIYIRKGIWEESQLTINKLRVQGVRLEQSLLKRIFGLTEVKLLMIQDEDSDVSTLYPFLPAKRAEEIVTAILPAYEVQTETKRLPRQALYARLFTTTIFALIISIPLWIIQPVIFGYSWISLWIGPILFGLITVYRITAYLQTAYTIQGSMIQWQTGGFGTSRFLTQRKQVIEVESSRGPLQRLFRLCSITLVNRGKPVEENILADIAETEMTPMITWYYGREEEIVRIDDTYMEPDFVSE